MFSLCICFHSFRLRKQHSKEKKKNKSLLASYNIFHVPISPSLALSEEKNTQDAKIVFTSLRKIVVAFGSKTYGVCMKIMGLQ